jgi:predicted Zn-dependent protease
MLVLQGRVSAAEQAFLMAEFLAPQSIVPPMSLARLYLAIGEESAARAAIERAAAIDPDAEGLDDLRTALGP